MDLKRSQNPISVPIIKMVVTSIYLYIFLLLQRNSISFPDLLFFLRSKVKSRAQYRERHDYLRRTLIILRVGHPPVFDPAYHKRKPSHNERVIYQNGVFVHFNPYSSIFLYKVAIPISIRRAASVLFPLV